MKKVIKKDCCRVCNHNDLTKILSLGDQSYTGRFPKPTDQDPPIEEISIVRCEKCGLVQMEYIYPPDEMYGQTYGYRSSITETMRNHLQGIRDLSLSWHKKSSLKNVLDIGSNDGTLLGFFNKKSENIVGIDPCAGKHIENYPKNATIIEDFFTKENVERSFSEKFDVVTSISMFYDLDDPVKFALDIKRILSDDGLWICEQSHSHSLIESNCYDSICHEHATYLSLSTFERICNEVGLKILDIRTNNINGGSFALVMSHESSNYNQDFNNINNFKQKEHDLKINAKETWIEFKYQVQKHKDDLINCIKQLKSENKKIFGYGASTKGNVILQYCGFSSKEIQFMLERDHLKYGLITPGSKIPIISEEEGRKMNPDVLIVFPWHFKDEIIKRESQFLEKGGKLLFPLPKIEIISKK